MVTPKISGLDEIIHEVRGEKIILDFDLAKLYEVETKALNQAVKRNPDRFPEDFMFRLTSSEWNLLGRSKNQANSNRSQIVTGSQKHREKSITPFAFTEQGISMLSGVLRSSKAIEVNIAIMRTFVTLRRFALSHRDLDEQIKKLEARFDKKFNDPEDAINYLFEKEIQENKKTGRRRIGFLK